MKNITLLVMVLALGVSNMSWAPGKDKFAPIGGTMSSSSPSNVKFGVGISSWEPNFSGNASLAGTLEFNPKAKLQVFLGIPGSNPFSFNLGGVFKAKVHESEKISLHVGGGLGLGVVQGTAVVAGVPIPGGGSSFALAIAGVAGFEVPFPGTNNVTIDFDGGVALKLTPAVEFSMGPMSSLLGMGVTYHL